MKIALVNYRYFISGGPERYLFNIKEVLEGCGHDVSVFSIKNSKNQPSPYEKYFLDSVDDEEYFADTKKSLSTVVKSFTRMFYSPEARRKFRQFLEDVRPDVVYILQYHNKISPSILDAARSMNIPVVHRISDFQYMCPNALFFNARTGVCEDCLKGKRLSCIRNKCVLDSTVYSAIKASAKLLHDAMHVTRRIDAFVVPSTLTLGKLAEYGIPADKLNHIPTFFNLKADMPEPRYGDAFVYVGRIARQKGLKTLIDAFAGTPYRLQIIGFADDGYDKELQQSPEGSSPNIEWLGRKDFGEISQYLADCRATIVPSEWYDNFPNSILESFAFSKPVIATDFGSLTDLVVDGVTGLTFKYGDSFDLRAKVAVLNDDADLARRLGQNAFKAIETTYSPERHYESLMKVFENVINK